MIYRLIRWVVWSLLASMMPFGAVYLMRAFSGNWPQLESVIGSGQLLISCVALVAGGAKELGGMPPAIRPRGRDLTLGLLWLLGGLTAIAYGFLANENLRAANGTPSAVSPEFVTRISVWVLALTVLSVSMAVMISHPVLREGGLGRTPRIFGRSHATQEPQPVVASDMIGSASAPAGKADKIQGAENGS